MIWLGSRIKAARAQRCNGFEDSGVADRVEANQLPSELMGHFSRSS